MQLRRQDVADIGNVHETYLEADGSITLVEKESTEQAEGATTPSEESKADREWE